MTFSKRGTIRQKANVRAWNHADRSNPKTEWRTYLANNGLNGISLHLAGFELFKKMLLVALGIWLSICVRAVRLWSTAYIIIQHFEIDSLKEIVRKQGRHRRYVYIILGFIESFHEQSTILMYIPMMKYPLLSFVRITSEKSAHPCSRLRLRHFLCELSQLEIKGLLVFFFFFFFHFAAFRSIWFKAVVHHADRIQKEALLNLPTN